MACLSETLTSESIYKTTVSDVNTQTYKCRNTKLLHWDGAMMKLSSYINIPVYIAPQANESFIIMHGRGQEDCNKWSKLPKTSLVHISKASVISGRWGARAEPRGYWRTTACSPCCHQAKGAEVSAEPPDCRTASSLRLWHCLMHHLHSSWCCIPPPVTYCIMTNDPHVLKTIVLISSASPLLFSTLSTC